MQNWNIDPGLRDYKLQANGAPEQTDSLTIPAYIRTKAPRLGWMYAPDNKYGSDFWRAKKLRTTDSASFIEQIAARALQPIAEDGRASQITVTAIAVARHGVGLQTEITDARGNVEQLVLGPIKGA